MNEEMEKSVVIRIRFPQYLYDWIREKSKKEMRPLAKQISYLIDKEYVKENNVSDLKRRHTDKI